MGKDLKAFEDVNMYIVYNMSNKYKNSNCGKLFPLGLIIIMGDHSELSMMVLLGYPSCGSSDG